MSKSDFTKFVFVTFASVVVSYGSMECINIHFYAFLCNYGTTTGLVLMSHRHPGQPLCPSFGSTQGPLDSYRGSKGMLQSSYGLAAVTFVTNDPLEYQ